MIIDLPRFLHSARPLWSELETELNRIEEEPDARLSLDQAKRLHFLYQRVAADLVQLDTFASEPALQHYLESLVARAYGEIHGGDRRKKKFRPFHWFFVQFPRVFQRRFAAFIVSIAVTLLGVAFGGFAVGLDPEAKSALLPQQFGHLVGDPAERVRQEESSEGHHGSDGHATFASYLMQNNIRVSIKSLALGMTFGVGTILSLFYNGIMVGLIAVDYIRAGQTIFLLGWLMPHGVIEIPAIVIAGQGGLVLAQAMIGRGSRLRLSQRLRAVSGDVGTLIGGVAVMLVWAGIIESFFSQYHAPVLPYSLKIAFGSVELALLIVLLARRGKADAETEQPAA